MWRACLFLGLLVGPCLAGFGDYYKVNLLAPPRNFSGEALAAWRGEIGRWRGRMRARIGYNGSVYGRLPWARASFVQPQVHLYDRFLYDEEREEFTVERFLRDCEARYGGVDSVLLWASYPSLGVDDRNQFDYLRALPGGLAALKNVTARFRERGVRVLLPYHAFDEGTRREEGSDEEKLAKLLVEVNADGANGDTMETMPESFFLAGLKLGKALAFEAEGGGLPGNDSYPDTEYSPETWEEAPIEDAKWLAMGWGYFGSEWPYPKVPGVDRAKWLDGRRMTHVGDRWLRNRTDLLQYAFFNGAGYSSWENVWGTWVGITERDGAALKRLATLSRVLGWRGYLQSFKEWRPHSEEVLRTSQGVYGSRWQHEDGSVYWTLVNRGGADVAGAQLAPSLQGEGWRFFDAWRGAPLELDARGEVSFDIEKEGYGAVLAVRPDGAPWLPELLSEMRGLAGKELGSLDAEWQRLPQTMAPGGEAKGDVRGGEMVEVPRGVFAFKTTGVEIEGGCDPEMSGEEVCCAYEGAEEADARCGYPRGKGEDKFGVDVMFPWEEWPRRTHVANLTLGPFRIDKYPVTCGDYAAYLESTGYRPRDAHNWLKGWLHGRGFPRPPQGWVAKPVTHVSLQEARAYCEWAGKRLPHSYEWQYAAQGTDGRRYPWGDERDEARFPRQVRDARTVPPLADVDAHPSGRSPFGVEDMVGNVWQWTDEFRDAHSRAALLKGSSLYVPRMANAAYRRKAAAFPMRRQFWRNRTTYRQFRNWYFPPALELTRHNKYMLMSASFERAGTVGFRCLRDSPETPPGPYHYSMPQAAAEETLFLLPPPQQTNPTLIPAHSAAPLCGLLLLLSFAGMLARWRLEWRGLPEVASAPEARALLA